MKIDGSVLHKNNFGNQIVEFTEQVRGNENELSFVFFLDDLFFQNLSRQRT